MAEIFWFWDLALTPTLPPNFLILPDEHKISNDRKFKSSQKFHSILLLKSTNPTMETAYSSVPQKKAKVTICFFCDDSTIEKKQLDQKLKTGKELPGFKPAPEGFICSQCRGFACKTCVQQIIEVYDGKKLTSKDRWCQEVKKRMSEGDYNAPILGHCCEWKQTLDTQPETPTDLKYDGYLVFPEFKVMLDSPFCSVDIHGLSNTTMNDAVWHGVIHKNEAALMVQQKPMGEESKLVWKKDIEIQFHPVNEPNPRKVCASVHYFVRLFAYHIIILSDQCGYTFLPESL